MNKKETLNMLQSQINNLLENCNKLRQRKETLDREIDMHLAQMDILNSSICTLKAKKPRIKNSNMRIKDMPTNIGDPVETEIFTVSPADGNVKFFVGDLK